MNDLREAAAGADRDSDAESQFAELLRSIWVAVIRATRTMEHLPTLPNQHVEVLQRLEATGGMTPAHLAIALRLSRPTVSELTRRMVEDGLIERVPSERDGRSVVLVPTDTARRVVGAFRRGVVDVVSAGLEGLPAREARRLLADVPALTHLLEQLQAIASTAESEAQQRFA